MKRNFGVALIVGALMLAVTELKINAEGGQSKIDRSVVVLNEPVRLSGILLQGRYLFLHHEGMMMRGKPCTYVYALDKEREGRLVLSFHCMPIARDKVADFKVVTRDVQGQPPVVIEVQFPGTVEGHQVPICESLESLVSNDLSR